ncbi:MAG: bifunctional 4-hydroxy-2-oxoglutarate aldolase/2-dehydro-3-deoxy-phosphogluconate aldolase [Campylobacterales bacterium]|nr:bifunctional 4-hydroxy-2-oxoglutarate aldolase/2-dehydro-3-deoxy-phosphogluconate aldolase [Campylobacterales bacterium]
MLSAREVMQVSKIIPVMSVNSVDESLRLCEALIEGGVSIFEITLRTSCAVDAIAAVAKAFPEATTGAGTVINPEQFKIVEDAGASFVISPGLTESLAKCEKFIPLLPGVATASDIMQGLEWGYDAFKLFPANIVGGIGALKAFGAPFSEVAFCPTGGINADNAKEFLALKNVVCVGGSWIVPADAIAKGDFKKVTQLTQEALRSLN